MKMIDCTARFFGIRQAEIDEMNVEHGMRRLVWEQALNETCGKINLHAAPPKLKWREMPNSFLFALAKPWHFESTNGVYQIYWNWGIYELRMGHQIISLDSCCTEGEAKAFAASHWIKLTERNSK